MAKKETPSKYVQALLDYKFTTDTVIVIPAVAGSGKSTAIVAHSFHMSDTKLVNAQRQKLCTFSNASSRDLQKKINEAYKGKEHKPQVTTLHGLASNILKENFDKNFTILSQWQSVTLIRSIMDAMGLFKNLEDSSMKQKTKIAMDVYNLIDKIKVNVQVHGRDYLTGNFRLSKYQKAKNISDEVFSKVLQEYNNKKSENNLYDYSDLLFKLVIMLEARPEILEKVRAETKLLYVDEAQDCDTLQQTLVLMLSRGQRLVEVGDLDQCIYSFRSASPEKFGLPFLSKFFKNRKEFSLPINYRSTANIVKVGNIVRGICSPESLQAIPNNPNEKGSVTLVRVQNTVQEASQVATIIKDELSEFDYKDMVIISRTNQYLKSVIEPALVREKIPYKFATKAAGRSLTKRDANILYINLIQLTLNPKNLGAIIELAPYIKGIGGSLQESIARDLMLKGSLDKLSVSSNQSQQAIKGYLELIKELKPISKAIETNGSLKDVSEGWERIVYKYMKPNQITEKETRTIQKVIAQFISYYRTETQIKNLSDMLQTMLIEINDFEDAIDKNMVTLSTVHGQKGLAHKVTIACGFTSHKELTDEFKDEANILYVQLSRAEKKLHMIYSDKYVTKDAKLKNGVVNFVLRKTVQLMKKSV